MAGIIWQLLMGLSIFLFGMSRLEAGIGALGSTGLKRVLAHSTGTAVGSAGLGAAVTAILQSSSMVSLLVLAFAAAGLLPLYNAIGVLLGANLGTTVTGWIVATLGFKLDLAGMALPLLAAGGLSQVALRPGHRFHALGTATLGLGLLLFGLSLMKDSVGDLPQRWDIGALQGYAPWVYLLVGTAVTALIQSSSAAVMLTLTALNAGLITLPEAGALVIGADLGTTSTTLLASIAGAPIKRQLALAQLVFNLVVDLGAFLLLLPLLPAAVSWLGLDDPLYSVVAFHSALNLLGLLVFLPLLRPFSRWIEGRFQPAETGIATLAAMEAPVPEAALPAMIEASGRLWRESAANNLTLFGLAPADLALPEALAGYLPREGAADPEASAGEYERIRGREAQLLQLNYRLQRSSLNESQSRQLQLILEIIRSTVYAAKTLQDIADDLVAIRGAATANGVETCSWLYDRQRAYQKGLYEEVLPLVAPPTAGGDPGGHPARLTAALQRLADANDLHFRDMDIGTHQRARSARRYEPELPRLLNVNREVHHSTRSVLQAAAGWIALAAAPGPEIATSQAGFTF